MYLKGLSSKIDLLGEKSKTQISVTQFVQKKEGTAGEKRNICGIHLESL